jgi:hypothetical protein
LAQPTVRRPVVDMMEVSESTRSGCSMTMVWAIMPPIDTPVTCAAAIPRWSSNPTASAAMSLIVYGGRPTCAYERTMSRRVAARPRSFVERPTSRLSKRMT